MGADIHVFVLNRNENTNSFEEVALYHKTKEGSFEKAYIGENRNYTLFSKLAGVRGCEDVISCGHKGFVWGCPEHIVEEYDDYGAHSATWFTWDALTLSAKFEGMTEYEDVENYNVVQEWVDQLETILNGNYIYSYSGVIVQIFFDN